ncbi:hypothetical protein NQZ79_g5695 [Umbelopsis isabellina]|nr:hypothetical protein NQZ79_g5695 [Umbelopsis isabellina]
MNTDIIDIGINLTDGMFRGMYRGKQGHADDFDLVLERARKAGVERMMITGGSLSESKEALELAETDDYDRTHFCPIEIQKKYFLRQFDLAEETGLPMFLHCRNTGSDFNDMIRANRTRFKGGVVHSFTGTMQEMTDLIELGLFIGINGCSLKTEENIEVVKAIPEDKLMLETDAPWCEIRPTHASFKYWKNVDESIQSLYVPPSKKKEKFERGFMVKSRNEPCAMGQVLYVVAAIRGLEPQELAEKVWKNTCQVFFPET